MISLPEKTQGNGVTDALECAITTEPESAASVTFALGGSSSNEQDAKKPAAFLSAGIVFAEMKTATFSRQEKMLKVLPCSERVPL